MIIQSQCEMMLNHISNDNNTSAAANIRHERRKSDAALPLYGQTRRGAFRLAEC